MNPTIQAGESLRASAYAAAVAALLATSAAALPAHAATGSTQSPATAPRATTTSFHFTNIPVRSALQLLAEECRFNLVVPDSVQGTVTLHLDDVTCDQALEIVLRMKGLGQRVEGGSRAIDSR